MVNVINSGVDTRGRVPPLTAKYLPKIGEEREKIGRKEERIGKKRQKSGRFFHFAPPDRQGWLRYYVLNNDYPTYY